MTIFNQEIKKDDKSCNCRHSLEGSTNPTGYEGIPFFRRAYNSLCKMQEAKDKKYGNSALKPLDIFAKHHAYGARIDEKLARVKYSDELRKNDVADIMGGLMLLCKENGWDNFDDLID